jgi:hypothetical protein
MKKENLVFNDCKKLIQLYISKNDIIWPKEIKLAKKLLALYPIGFFEQYSPGVAIYSLAAFLTPGGKKNLRENFDLYTLTKPKDVVVLQDKPVVDIEFVASENKIRTLKDFADSKN